MYSFFRNPFDFNLPFITVSPKAFISLQVFWPKFYMHFTSLPAFYMISHLTVNLISLIIEKFITFAGSMSPLFQQTSCTPSKSKLCFANSLVIDFIKGDLEKFLTYPSSESHLRFASPRFCQRIHPSPSSLWHFITVRCLWWGVVSMVFNPPAWRTITSQWSMTAYSTYFQIPPYLEVSVPIHNYRTQWNADKKHI